MWTNTGQPKLSLSPPLCYWYRGHPYITTSTQPINASIVCLDLRHNHHLVPHSTYFEHRRAIVQANYPLSFSPPFKNCPNFLFLSIKWVVVLIGDNYLAISISTSFLCSKSGANTATCILKETKYSSTNILNKYLVRKNVNLRNVLLFFFQRVKDIGMDPHKVEANTMATILFV